MLATFTDHDTRCAHETEHSMYGCRRVQGQETIRNDAHRVYAR